MFVAIGARDFSPEITVLPIGTEVPCSDNGSPQISIYQEVRVANLRILFLLPCIVVEITLKSIREQGE